VAHSGRPGASGPRSRATAAEGGERPAQGRKGQARGGSQGGWGEAFLGWWMVLGHKSLCGPAGPGLRRKVAAFQA
jgi:hypothetical protein